MNDKIKELYRDTITLDDKDIRAHERALHRLPPLYQTENEEPEKEPEWPKVQWPKDNPFLKVGLNPPQLRLPDGIDNPIHTITEKILASLVDKEDEVIVQAITEYAKEEGFTELILIDKEFIRDAIKKQIRTALEPPEDEFDSIGACPNCHEVYGLYGIRNHDRSNYCANCGQAIDWEVMP